MKRIFTGVATGAILGGLLGTVSMLKQKMQTSPEEYEQMLGVDQPLKALHGDPERVFLLLKFKGMRGYEDLVSNFDRLMSLEQYVEQHQKHIVKQQGHAMAAARFRTNIEILLMRMKSDRETICKPSFDDDVQIVLKQVEYMVNNINHALHKE